MTTRLFLLLLLTCTACASRDDADMRLGVVAGEGEYVVDGTYVALHGADRVLVNDILPAGRYPGYGVIGSYPLGASLGATLTPALVSGANTVAVEVVPLVRRPGASSGGIVDPDGRSDDLDFGPVRFAFRVLDPSGRVVPGTERPVAASDAAFAAWRCAFAAEWPRWRRAEDSLYAARPILRDSLAALVVTDAEAAWGGRGPALDRAWAWARTHPVRVVASFVRPGGVRPTDGQPVFDAVLRDAPVIAGTAADSVRLRAFAVELGRKRVARDTAAVWNALAYALGREFVVVGGEARLGMDSLAFMSDAREHIVTSDVFPFEAEDVELTSWAGGRVWELSLRGQRGLLVHPEVAAGRSGTMRRISVGVGPNGELRVVWAS